MFSLKALFRKTYLYSGTTGMDEMGFGKGVVNWVVAVFAMTSTFIILNALVAEAGALDGISLTEYLADEFRIRFLKVGDNSGYGCNGGRDLLIPGCEGVFRGAHVRIPPYRVSINSFGLRDREYSLDKPEGTFRIFALGDSTTFGEGVDHEEIYTELLEKEMNQGFEARFEVFNLGVGGMSTDDEYHRLLVYWNYSPDLVILQSHPNDIIECGSMRQEVDSLIEESLGITLPEDDVLMEFSVRTRTAQLREEYARLLGEDRRCSCVLENLGKMISLAETKGIQIIVFGIDDAEGASCFSADNKSYALVLSGPYGRRFRLSRSDAHLNAAGHRELAKELLPAVVDAISTMRPEVLE